MAADAPPVHTVPASTQFSEAVGHGYGWGMLPDLERRGWPEIDLASVSGSVLRPFDVALFWQQWTLHTSSLDKVAAAVREGAAASLRPQTAP